VPTLPGKIPETILALDMFKMHLSCDDDSPNCLRLFPFFAEANKKADVDSRPQAFDHVGLLCNRPPAEADCHLSSRPTTYIYLCSNGKMPLAWNTVVTCARRVNEKQTAFR
jgi:hypothetical protein